MKNLTILLTVLALTTCMVHASENYTDMPGFVDLSDLDKVEKVGEVVEIQIRKPLLKLVAALNQENDQELTDLIAGLHLISVKTFNYGKSSEEIVRKLVNGISRKLERSKWEKVVSAKTYPDPDGSEQGEEVSGKDSTEHSEIFIQIDDDKINGLMVIVLEDREAVFVNIVGTIDFTKLGKIGAKFDIPGLDDIAGEIGDE